MQETQTETIKKLIQTSPLLSETERAEWFSLVGLMSDKQLLELQNILTAPPRSKPSPATAENLPVVPKIAENNPLHIEKPVSRAVPQPNEPHLSHILNAPIVPNRPAIQHAVPPITHQKPDLSKPRNNFLNKIKSVLSEKQLPVNREPLEISNHTGQDRAMPDKNISTDQQVLQKVVPQVSKIPKEVPQPRPASPPAPSHSLPHTLPSVPDSEMPVGSGQLPSRTRGNVPETSVFRAGIDPKILLNAKYAPKREQSKVPTRDLTPLAPLNTVKDIANMGLVTWQGGDKQTIASQLKKLVHQYSYHEVRFALEHSPLYAAYIDTGLKILSEGVSFEYLFKPNPEALPKSYLTKSEFEQFTDMLRQLQAE